MLKIPHVFLLALVGCTICGCAKSDQIQENSWKVDFDAAYSAMQAKNFVKAEASYHAAIDSIKVHEKHDARLAKTYTALGDLYLLENKTEDAKRAFSNSYTEYKALWNSPTSGLDRRDSALGLATSALHLANIACDALRLDEAERLYNESLVIEESALGSDGLKGQILSGKARLFKLTGRTSEATKVESQITDLKALPTVDDTKELSWKELNTNANDTFASGNLTKSESLFQSGLERAVKPTQKAESLRGLARIYDQRKEYSVAIQKLAEARQILMRGEEHRLELADNWNTAGWIFLDANDFEKSEHAFAEGLRLMNLKEHNEGLRARVSLQGLMKVLAAKGNSEDDADAEKYAQQKLALTQQLYGKNDARYVEDLLAIAILQAKQKKNDEASKGFQSVIAMEEDNPSPRYMLAALDSYAKFLRDTKQDSIADAIELKAKNLRAEFE